MSEEKIPHVLGMNTAELEGLAESLGEPRFRGRQIANHLYKRNVTDFDEMSDLPASFRSTLRDRTILYRSKITAASRSQDGATRFLLGLEDGQQIESVLLPYEERVSVCVSTQVGCAAGCAFCASAIGGLARNLTAGEIVDEVLTMQHESLRRITHVVYMGMGEPLLNFDHVLKSIHLLNKEVGIAMRHITISTVGITPRIDKLSEERLQLTLAVSLHAPNDRIRSEIIPLAERYPIGELIAACREYAEITGRRITFEYLLIRGVNDSPATARELAQLLRGVLCFVNLIPYNAVERLAHSRPSKAAMDAFRETLEKEGITVTQRVERGHTVSAACGQLRRRRHEP